MNTQAAKSETSAGSKAIRAIDGALPGEIGIHFGALCPTIERQVREQLPKGMRLKNGLRQRLSTAQKLAESITWLSLHGLIGDAQKRQLQLKLMRRISAIVREQLGIPPPSSSVSGEKP